MTLYRDTGIRSAEKYATCKLLDAFETSHKYHLVSTADEQLVCDDGLTLSAVSCLGRLKWAKELCRRLGRYFDYDPVTGQINTEMFFLTLVDIGCVRGSEEYDIDLVPIKRRLRRGLKGLDYIGVIEPGLYPHISFQHTNLSRSKCVSWHLHALVWNRSVKQIKKLVRKLNKSGLCVPITPQQDGVVGLRVTWFPGIIGYMLKPPKNAYRIGVDSRTKDDPLPRHIQYKDPLRPGERVTLYLQMQHLYLDQMWVSGGLGASVLNTTRRQALADFRESERRSTRRGKRPLYSNR